MNRSRSAILGLLLMTIALLLNVGCSPVTVEASQLTRATDATELRVTLSAAHATTSWDVRDPDQHRFELPLLYLHHQRELADAAERTLEVRISGLAGGSEVQIEVQSYHANVETGKPHMEAQSLNLPDRPCIPDTPCKIQWTFDAATMLSDLYTLRVKDKAGHVLWENPYPDRPDFVALDTWETGLGEYAVQVTYATLFPFARGQKELEDRLPPGAVTEFIETQFAPIIIDTWYTQVEAWGFGQPLHPEWDPDKVVEVFITDPPFALFNGTGTYSRSLTEDGGLYPERRIWWYATNNSFQTYDSLGNAYKAVFAHEFFHLMQWNVLLFTERPASRWRNIFIEAQGKFASAVQYPEIELGREVGVLDDREYAGAANRFLARQLNASYRDLEADPFNKYDAALYWRFLYEEYGDMDVIRAALEEMAVQYNPDILRSFENVMNATFLRLDGPFLNFEESLVAFARANYALRLENGRCAAADLTDCDGFHLDPQNVYAAPPLEAKLTYDGVGLTNKGFTPTSSGVEFAEFSDSSSVKTDTTHQSEQDDILLAYSGAIPASYGMDFIEVSLDPALQGQPLTIMFQGEGPVARFSVQVWKLGIGEIKPRAVTAEPETVPQNTFGSGAHVYIVPSVDSTAYDRFALIITRLDSDETTDPAGNYSITLDSSAYAEIDTGTWTKQAGGTRSVELVTDATVLLLIDLYPVLGQPSRT